MMADERALRQRIDDVEQDNASLRRGLVDHPAAVTLRFCAPLIRDAITAGVWQPGPGPESVERELAATLAWLDRMEKSA